MSRRPPSRPQASPGSAANAHDYAGDELAAMAEARRYYDWLIAVVAPYLRGRVAEVGAGVGTVSTRLLSRPIASLTAYEPSAAQFAELATRLADEPRARAVNGTLPAAPGEGSPPFDGVLYLNVLEHIADDAGELRRAVALLAGGGHLVVYSPALPWLYSAFDRAVGHVRRYTGAELAAKLAAAGLEVVECRYMDLVGVLPWYLSMTLRGGRLSPAKTRLYDRWGVPLTRRLEAAFRPPLGKNVLGVGRKPGP